MNRPYQLIVFDWEGTLGDTLGQVLNTIEKEARLLNLGSFDKILASNYVSFGLIKLINKIYPKLSWETQAQLLQAVERTLLTNPMEVCLISNAEWIIKLLYENGFTLAIASNKGQQSLQKSLSVSGLQEYFSITRTASQTSPKPCPQMIREIIEEAGIDHRATLMVGDSVTDIEMAKKATVDVVGVDFYHGEKDRLMKAGALKVFDNYHQLADFLNLKGN